MVKPLVKIDESVIARVREGDVAAFDVLYRTYCQRLFGFVLQIIKTETDAEEIVQEVFLKLWETRLQIDKHAVFESYLFTIAHNTTISLIRKRLSEKKYVDYISSLQEVTSASEPDGETEFKELSQQLQNLLEKLPTRQKEVFLLHREEGLTYQQIAEKLDISKNTVENHIAKALQFLRKNLGGGHFPSLLFICLFLESQSGVFI
ncbi:RNA polymerase sigma factor [Mariniphaga sediminis]|uniref:RNA polymerase sigma factor n=1 Tax=Mariniphaga sediminis TaxID=1628158 RepID=UPI0035693B5E